MTTMKAERMSTENHHQPMQTSNSQKRHTCFCLQCRVLYENRIPPTILAEGIDTRFTVEKRFVPGGPNPLHN